MVQLVRMPPCHGGGRGFESHPGRQFASVAQLVEHVTENHSVVGSIPTGGTIADLAHLVERDLAKVEVAGSSPVIRSNKKNSPPIGGLFFLLELRGENRRSLPLAASAMQFAVLLCKRRRLAAEANLHFSTAPPRLKKDEHP